MGCDGSTGHKLVRLPIIVDFRLSHSLGEVPEESQYITNEAQDLFRKNRFLKDPAEIDAKIFEAESRMELAFHYRIPVSNIMLYCL